MERQSTVLKTVYHVCDLEAHSFRDGRIHRQEKLKQYALMNDASLLSVALEYAGNPSVSLPEAELSAAAQQMYALLPKQVAANECRQLFTPHQQDDTDIATSNVHFQLVQ